MRRTFEPTLGRPTAVVVAAVLAGAALLTALDPVGHPEGEIAEPMSLSSASARDLEMLPGVGPSLAERIVADRSARGPFRSVDDLQRVKGVGPGMLDRIQPFVVP